MALVSSSRTPREQMLMSYSRGRARMDVMRFATNPTKHGRKAIDVSHMAANTKVLHKTGKKKIDASSCRAVAVADGSANADVPIDKKHFQRRHFDNSGINSLVYLPEPKPIKRGLAHVPGPVSKMDPKEENIYSRKEEIAQQKQEFRRMSSPTPHNFTFQPVSTVDHRDQESRLLADGSKRKERSHPRPTSPEQALTPPWAVSA